jgi:hypothetical protein
MVHWEDDYQPLSDARMLARDAMHACYYWAPFTSL